MSGKTVLILGGGVGGIVSANALRQRLGPEHRIVVVDKQGEYVFTPSLLWVMAGWRQPGQIAKDLRQLLRPGVEMVQAEVLEIDPNSQRVRTSGGDLAYDYLVVTLGADLSPESLPGYADTAHDFYTLEGASGLRAALQRFEAGRAVVLVSTMPYKCPAAPYEAALLLDDTLRRRGIRSRCQVEVFTPEKLPMPVAGPVVGQAVVEMLKAKGIGFHPGLQPDRVEPGTRELVFADGQRESFDLLAAVPPHRAPRAVQGSPLANPSGWVPVDRHTLKTTYENVYAVGDVTAITLPNGKLLPKAGVFAHAEAETVAQTIADQVQGRLERHEFDGTGYCWIEMGGGVAGFASGQFYAEPEPMVALRRPGRMWHWGKVFFERYWLGKGIVREMARLGINLGSKVLGIPASL